VKNDIAAFAFQCFPKTSDIPAGLQDQPLDTWSGSCRISPRLADVLRRSGIRVLGDLHGRKVGDFARERNCGFKTLHELDSLVRRAQFWEKGLASGNGIVPGPGSSAFAEATADKPTPATAAAIPATVPESVCQLQFDELPITKRLANVVRSVGLRTLGDLNGRSPLELLQWKDCGWGTVGEIQQLIERALSGEFDVVRHPPEQLPDSAAVAELLILLEHGIAKLSPRQRQFLLARIGGEGLPCLTFKETGRRHGLTRARAHQVVVKALDTLRKTYGPRIPRLLEMMKRRCLSIPNASELTPAFLEQWIGDSAKSLRLTREAQLRLIAALDKNIPCWVESSPKAFGSDKLDLNLAGLARALRLATAPEIPRSRKTQFRAVVN
jgi:hypothetical protein